MEKYYDEVWYPKELHRVHYKAAVGKRNEWFVNDSNLLIAYVEREEGGAYLCMKMAIEKGTAVKNIAEW